MVLIRAACLAAASLLLALALKRMPIAETSSIVFLGPILVVVMAGPILHENIGMVGWVAAIAGFTGVLFIARPGAGLDTVGVALAFSTAVVTAIYQLLSRVLARSESTLAMLFYSAVVGAVLFGACAPWFWGGERPTLLHVISLSGDRRPCRHRSLLVHCCTPGCASVHAGTAAICAAPLRWRLRVGRLWACTRCLQYLGHVRGRGCGSCGCYQVPHGGALKARQNLRRKSNQSSAASSPIGKTAA